VLQLAAAPRDAERYAKIAASDLFEPGALAVVPAQEAAARLGEPAPGALDMRTALTVEPACILSHWAGEVQRQRVAGLDRQGGAWILRDPAGHELATVDVVILAAAHGAAALWPEPALQPVRGQASWVRGFAPGPAVAWGGYAIPMRDGVLFGATHDRDDAAADLRAGDGERNLQTLAKALPNLAARLTGQRLEGRAAIRATTADRLPLAGAAPGAPPGLFLLGGLGARGFALAPLLGEHLAALALGAPSPLPTPLAELVDPSRFRKRAARRGHDFVAGKAQNGASDLG
jgi:tRNA 5-methylaminomethyl-2-thiouridine biosynthesis bifunctional protein